ncbi:MAG: hypothetical protein KDA96_09110 [Planctomycetaceae bacterium]|nr:hypothetical protein [Planctomycetaceae bacterium]
MKTRCLIILVVFATFVSVASVPTAADEETSAIERLTEKGFEIRTDSNGHAIRLMSSGKGDLTAADYQLIGKLTHLEQMGLNAAPLKADEWQFLKALPRLKTLSIWHGHHFATLEPFSGLPVESLTIGGCMGLRDLNKDAPDRLRNAITTLHDLPHLKKVSLYHSPLAPDDTHLKHLAQNFPTLEDLRLDFSAPRGSETLISPNGLKVLQTLPLKVLSLENAQTFTTEHMAAIADIRSLTQLLIDCRRQPVADDVIDTFRRQRPDVQVAVAQPGDPGPPVVRPPKR